MAENRADSFSFAASPGKAGLLEHNTTPGSPSWSIKAGPTRIPGPPGTPADQKVDSKVRSVATCRHLPPAT